MAGPVRFIPTGQRVATFREEYYDDPTKRRRTTVLLDGSQTVEELNYQTRERRKKIRLCLLKIGFALLFVLIVFFAVEYYAYGVDMVIEAIAFGSVLVILLLVLIFLSICEAYCPQNTFAAGNRDSEQPIQSNGHNSQTSIQNSMDTLPPDYGTATMEGKKENGEKSPPPTYGKESDEE